MITFAIETSSQISSLALFTDERILASVRHQSHKLHTGFFKVVEDTLKELKLSPKEISRVIVGTGPGSFTGVRIGVSLAKSFCQLTGAELFSVRSYFLGLNEYERGVYYIPVIPSTRTECYASLFLVDEEGKIKTIREIDDGGPVRIAAWISKLSPDACICIYGEGLSMFSDMDIPSGVKVDFKKPDETSPNAENVFNLLKKYPEIFESGNPIFLKPLYVRPSPAELKKIDSRKGDK